MFLLSAICSLIFLQSKGRKKRTLWQENTKIIRFIFRNNLLRKNTIGESGAPSLLKRAA